MKRTSLVPSGDDPLSIMGGGTTLTSVSETTNGTIHTDAGAAAAAAAAAGVGASAPLSASSSSSSGSSSGTISSSTTPHLAPTTPVKTRLASASVSSLPYPAAANPLAQLHQPGASPLAAAAAASRATDPDDIIVDNDRQRDILKRQERKEHQPLYVGRPAVGSTRAPALSVGSAPGPLAAASSARPAPAAAVAAAAASSASPPTPSGRRGSLPGRVATLPCRSRDWHPSSDLTRLLPDDWDSHGRVPGEHAVMQIPDVLAYNAHDEPGGVAHSVLGVLFMTSYQIFVEPTQRRDRLGAAVVALPLSCIERIEMDKTRPAPSVVAAGSVALAASSHTPPLHYLELHAKDGRFMKLGFGKVDEHKRAYDCLSQYVFPLKDEFLFAFYYRLRVPLPPALDGWNIYDPLSEFKRQGINTLPLLPPASQHSTELRLSWANENYTLCSSYPRVLVVPSERYCSDVDLLVVGQFRSRGRIPTCTWKHPTGRQSIWRCSQPRVGMNNARCAEDEKLLSALTTLPDMFAIFDARPLFNARANILAGKGFENPDLYRNAVKKVFFLNIENIHKMREAHAKLVRACAREQHDATFLTQVAHSGWLSHISICLKATAEMVKAIDQDKISLLIHCSDGWDRTAQLAGLVQLCLDPYYRTTKGFFVLIEKFARRTGHKDKNYADDQRSCIFLQWCDSVYQLLRQFPRHFEFNSHMLVTIVHHLYSCRFGTFLHNTDMARRKNKLHEKTISIWTYLMCSPAAIAGEFTNQLYSKSGNGAGAAHAAAAAAAAAHADADDSTVRSSVGRGGGDGSATAVGTVLYPCWSLKSVTLWSDYFLRWNNEQCEQVPVGGSAGSVPPGGAATTRFGSPEATLQAELRRVAQESAAATALAAKQTERVRELEAEIAALKQRYGAAAEGAAADGSTAASAPVASESSAAAAAATDAAQANGVSAAPPAAASVTASLAIGSDSSATTASSSSSASSADDAESDGGSSLGGDAEAAALAELKKRLLREVDANVREDVEAPEDPRTL